MKFLKSSFNLVLVILWFAPFLITKSTSAQTSDAQYFVPEPFPKSPNVASFTKYGDYDISEYTGVPNISIPLYTIEAGSLKIPLTLSYHASGIKLTDAASWTGLGWSLAGGGAVSRRIIGGPDDGTYGYFSFFKANRTFNMNVDSDMLYVDNVASGLYDTRPDIYSFDFPGHSGKFFFDGTNGFKPVVIPYAPININYSKTLQRFIFTDEHGNVYKFGEADVETTHTSGAGKTNVPSISSWLPESMISQNRRDTVTFSYGVDSLFYPDATSQMQVLTDGVGFDAGNTTYYYTANIQQPTINSISTLVNELPLQQINFRNGKVVFELDTALRKDINLGISNNVHSLKDVKVYAYNYATKQMEVEKTVMFYHSYFGTAAANNRRMRLDSIQILDKAGSVVQHYRFGYNTSITLPGYGSYARDYWGYYNGKTTSTSLIPQMTVPYNGGTTTIGGTLAHNRDCDSNFMQAYVLDTIYYPTGGHTVFKYQSNQFTNYLGQTQVAGGLRVTSISSYDNLNTIPRVRTYVYNSADSNYCLQYNFFAAPAQTHRYYITYRGGVVQVMHCTVHNYVSNPNVDVEPLDATSVVYPNVTEYEGTPSNNTGKTDYVFAYEHDDIETASSATATPVINSYFFARGQLLSKTESMRKSDGSYQAVKNETNYYAAFPLRQYLGVGFVARKINTNEGAVSPNDPIYADSNPAPNDVSSYNTYPYWIYCQDNLPVSSTTKVYDINDSTKYTTSTVNYTYDDTTHLQLTKTSHVDSRGNTHITMTKHAHNYFFGGTTNSPLLDSMINRHMYADVIEKWDSVKNVAALSNYVSGAQLNQYQAGSIVNTIVPSKISTLSASTPITDFTPTFVNGSTHVITADSRYVQMISFDAYDNKNNITYYTPRNATPTAILWDYLFENPVAQIKNAPFFSSISDAYTSFEADGKGNWTFSGAPVNDITAPTGSKVYPLSAGSVTSSYNVSKPGIISYWSNNGAATVMCGSTNVTGTAMTTANGWTYYEHSTPAGPYAITISGSTSIDELRMYPADAQMITYAYSPDGLTSIADAKGAISHFEYDYAQRLHNIRDFYGNIVNNYSYHTYDQGVGNDAMSSSSTRNNCPPNTNPGSLTYSVPAGKYLSSTKASANADATYDLNVNGQAKANQYCGCPVITTSFTLSNSTGISGFQATFSGISSPYNFPTTGSTVITVPVGTYVTISVGPVGSQTHTFGLTGYTSQSNVHSASFSNVSVTTGSNLTLSIQ